ncbi:MAG: sensor histidine kinase [Paracoccaceae bacterium]
MDQSRWQWRRNSAIKVRMQTVRTRFFRSLAGQFLIAGSVVMAIAALIIGNWVERRIEQGVVQSSAISAALYMESFISPLSQELADDAGLSEPARTALHEIFETTALKTRVVSYKIWKEGGLIVEASDPALRGGRFEPGEELLAAWNGAVGASFEDFEDGEDDGEAALGIPLLEVYSPIRELWTGEIIAVAEFYERADELARELADAKRNSWLIVAGVFATSGALLFGIVGAGSRLIERQRMTLQDQLAESRRMSEQNLRLRERVMQAAQRSTAQSDRVMQRIGQDLHDGIAQHLSLASLRFEEAAPADAENAETVRVAMAAAMRELRAISRGLALPDIDQLDPHALVTRAVEDHRKLFRSNVTVENALDAALPLDEPAKLCIYRFLQEALTNAARHGEADAIAVNASHSGATVTVEVSDNGKGFAPETPRLVGDTGGQGLMSLRDRAETLNGQVSIRSRPGQGTAIELTLPIEKDSAWRSAY